MCLWIRLSVSSAIVPLAITLPFSSNANRSEARRANATFCSTRITVILVEQNVAFARRASDRFALLEKGKVVAKGAIAELTDDLIQRHMAV